MGLQSSNEMGLPPGSSVEEQEANKKRLQVVFGRHLKALTGEHTEHEDIIPEAHGTEEPVVPPPREKRKFRDGKMASANDDF